MPEETTGLMKRRGFRVISPHGGGFKSSPGPLIIRVSPVYLGDIGIATGV